MEKKYTRKQIDEMFEKATDKVLDETHKQVERFMKEQDIKDGHLMASQLLQTTVNIAQLRHYFWEGK